MAPWNTFALSRIPCLRKRRNVSAGRRPQKYSLRVQLHWKLRKPGVNLEGQRAPGTRRLWNEKRWKNRSQLSQGEEEAAPRVQRTRRHSNESNWSKPVINVAVAGLKAPGIVQTPKRIELSRYTARWSPRPPCTESGCA